MEAVISLAEGDEGGEHAVPRRGAGVVASGADEMSERVHAERRLQDDGGTEEPGDEQPAPRVAPLCGDDRWQDESDPRATAG